MTREDFDRLVAGIEQRFASRLGALRRHTLGLVLLGFGALALWASSGLVLAALFLSVLPTVDAVGKVFCVLAALGALFVWLVSVLPLFRVTPRPTGVPLRETDAPALFAELAALSRRLNAVPIHDVRLTVEFNAAVVQTPRLGWLGWTRNHLLLGLPAMDVLSPEEMRAVLAHELAHLSRDDGRLGHWLYRLRQTWSALAARTEKQPAAGRLSPSALARRFLTWFWPRFNAHAFVLSRAQEYAADRTAAGLTNAAAMGSALIQVESTGLLFSETLWPAVWELAKTKPEPPVDLFARLHAGLAAHVDDDACARRKAAALRATSTNTNTHPCLRERLHALGVSAAAPAAPPRIRAKSAAEAWFGGELPRLTTAVTDVWRDEASENWREHHARAAALANRFSSIESTEAAGRFDASVLWDKAVIHLRRDEEKSAEPLLAELLGRQPHHAAATFQLGRIRLQRDEAAGEVDLERAIELDESLLEDSAPVLREYYRRAGLTQKLQALSVRLDRHESVARSAQQERTRVEATDEFLPHGLDDSLLGPLRALLAANPQLVAADLGRKRLLHRPHERLFVLCLHAGKNCLRLRDRAAEDDAARQLGLKIELPGRVLVVAASGSYEAVARKIARGPDSRIWSRPA